jgi:hypothetical protein
LGDAVEPEAVLRSGRQLVKTPPENSEHLRDDVMHLRL